MPFVQTCILGPEHVAPAAMHVFMSQQPPPHMSGRQHAWPTMPHVEHTCALLHAMPGAVHVLFAQQGWPAAPHGVHTPSPEQPTPGALHGVGPAQHG